MPVSQPKGEPILLTEDEHPRADTTLEALSKLRALLNGVFTTGNCSGENDGAAVCIIMSMKKADELAI